VAKKTGAQHWALAKAPPSPDPNDVVGECPVIRTSAEPQANYPAAIHSDYGLQCLHYKPDGEDDSENDQHQEPTHNSSFVHEQIENSS
jgi:hypothetical protein